MTAYNSSLLKLLDERGYIHQATDAALVRGQTIRVIVANADALGKFYADGFDQKIARFCFAKRDETLLAAAEVVQRGVEGSLDGARAAAGGRGGRRGRRPARRQPLHDQERTGDGDRVLLVSGPGSRGRERVLEPRAPDLAGHAIQPIGRPRAGPRR